MPGRVRGARNARCITCAFPKEKKKSSREVAQSEDTMILTYTVRTNYEITSFLCNERTSIIRCCAVCAFVYNQLQHQIHMTYTSAADSILALPREARNTREARPKRAVLCTPGARADAARLLSRPAPVFRVRFLSARGLLTGSRESRAQAAFAKNPAACREKIGARLCLLRMMRPHRNLALPREHVIKHAR